VNRLAAKQLFTDCIEPNAPPSSPMSAPPGRVPLSSNALPETRLPDAWKKTVRRVGGNGSGFSKTRTPKLGLPRIVLCCTRSA